MAERRMFAKTIIDSDAFLDMPLSAQALYFHLSMRADDEGFINNPKKIQRMVGASDDDAKLLCTKHFLIPFESGVVVIKHWRIHNYIRGDRLQPTAYEEEKSLLKVKDNGAYTLDDGHMSDIWLTSDGQVTDKCQHRLGKDRIDKDSLGKDRIEKEKKKTSLDYFNELIDNYQITEAVRAELVLWIQYKMERREGYAEKGMEAFLRQIEKNLKKHGEEVMIDSIENSMGNGWMGIHYTDSNQNLSKTYTKQTKAEELNKFYEMSKEWADE